MTLNLDGDADRLQDLTEFGATQARNSGIDRAKFVCTTSKLIRLVSENGEFTLANSLDSKKISVMIHHNQCKGAASTNSDAKEDLLHILKQAKDLAGFSIPDSYLTMPDAKVAPQAIADPRMYDENIESVTIADLKDAVSPIIEDIVSDERIALERFEITASVGVHHLANSLGVRQVEIQSSIDWDMMGMATEDDDVSGFDYDSGFSFTRAGFREKLQKDAEKFKQRVLQNLNPRPSPSYRGLVILSPRALEDLLIDPILYQISGYQIMDGKSRWEDSLGQKITNTPLSMVDEPADLDLDGATTYDSDGLPTNRMVIIQDGVLLHHLWDCYSGNRTNRTSNAMGGGPFGLHVLPGQDRLQTFFSARKEIVLLDRFSGNVDPLTGDFSGVAKTSSLYVDGERAFPISETMIAGNTFELLNQIVGISHEQENVSGEYKSPYMLVDGLSVSAK